MSNKWIFAAVGILALIAGAALWMGTQGHTPDSPVVEASPATLYAATFHDLQGGPQSLGRFEGKVVVLNFWATWCAPCREEMPAFGRIQSRWAAKGVQFVGISNEEPGRVQPFAKGLGVSYPLWVGGDEVGELSRRLGNRLGGLPHTVLIDRSGNVLESRVGTYPEDALERRLAEIAAK
ncbi:MAG TPA: redoxin domain-containing protein [Usitatibacter sp.]|nr:redoxin domain-containing protein [Usitatibacter sp.]